MCCTVNCSWRDRSERESEGARDLPRDHDTVTIPCDLHCQFKRISFTLSTYFSSWSGQAPYIETRTHSLSICCAPFDCIKRRQQIDILLSTTSVTCTALHTWPHNRNQAKDNTTRHIHDSDSCISHSFDALRFNGLPARSPSSTGKGTGKVKLRCSGASILGTPSNVPVYHPMSGPLHNNSSESMSLVSSVLGNATGRMSGARKSLLLDSSAKSSAYPVHVMGRSALSFELSQSSGPWFFCSLEVLLYEWAL